MEVRRLKDDELQHHGILGMKWGVRRYQNKDGSLTAEGYRHYGYTNKDGSLTNKGRREYITNNKYLTKDIDSTGVYEAVKEYKELQKDLDLLNINGNDAERIDKAADTGLKALQDIGEYNIGNTGNYYTEPQDVKENVKEWFLYEDQTFGMSEVADLANQGKSAKEIQNIVEKIQSTRYNKEVAVEDYIDKIADTNLSQFNLSYSDKDYIENLIFKMDKDDAFDTAAFDIDEGAYRLTPTYIKACVKVAAREKGSKKKDLKKKIDDAAYVGVSIGQLIAETLM